MYRAVLLLPIILMAPGCVGWGTYDELHAKHDHLLDVKEQWESEQQSLETRVEDTARAYQHVSVEQTSLKHQVDRVIDTMRSAKEDLRIAGVKIDRQDAILRTQQEQMTDLGKKFVSVMSQVATLAETNSALANRMDQILVRLNKVVQAKHAGPAESAKTKHGSAQAKAALDRPDEAVVKGDDKSDKSKVASADSMQAFVPGVQLPGSAAYSLMNPVVPGVGPSVGSVASTPQDLPQTEARTVPSLEKQHVPEVASVPVVPAVKPAVIEAKKSFIAEWIQKLRPTVVKAPVAPKPSAMTSGGGQKASDVAEKSNGEAFAAPMPSDSLTISTHRGVPATGPMPGAPSSDAPAVKP
ncbi:MAG: hypothetical protein P0119_13705 [Nitrospira sp.]|nr:hypothetical protein [Nitrospira sp.]